MAWHSLVVDRLHLAMPRLLRNHRGNPRQGGPTWLAINVVCRVAVRRRPGRTAPLRVVDVRTGPLLGRHP